MTGALGGGVKRKLPKRQQQTAAMNCHHPGHGAFCRRSPCLSSVTAITLYLRGSLWFLESWLEEGKERRGTWSAS